MKIVIILAVFVGCVLETMHITAFTKLMETR